MSSKIEQQALEFKAELQQAITGAEVDITLLWQAVADYIEAVIREWGVDFERAQEMSEDVLLAWLREKSYYQQMQGQLLSRLELYRNGVEDTIQDSVTTQMERGIEEAVQLISSVSGGLLIPVQFNRLPYDSLETLIGRLKSDVYFSHMLKTLDFDVITKLNETLVSGLALGEPLRDIARRASENAGVGLSRAMTITRTEIIEARRLAAYWQYQESADVLRGWKRMANKKSACMACLLLDSTIHPVSEMLDDHPNGACEISGNEILTDAPNAFETLSYDGDIIIIRTASGKLHTVTTNHPILTDRGWVPAKKIKKGTNIVCDTVSNRASLDVSPDKYKVPTLVENIPSAFDMLRLGSVPESAKHLNSNGIDGEVEVVFADRLLWNGLDTNVKKHIIKTLFFDRGAGLFSLYGFGDFTSVFKSVFSSTSRFLSFLYHSGLLFLRELGHIELTSLFNRAPLDAFLIQNTSDNAPGYIQRNRDRLLGLSRDVPIADVFNLRSREVDNVSGVSLHFDRLNLGTFGFIPKQPLGLEMIRKSLIGSVPPSSTVFNAISRNIVFDSVSEVGIRAFSGHVYNLQTSSGWYSSNHIISHNCTAVPVVKGVSEPAWQTGKEYFESLSPEMQQSRMGYGKFEAWQDGQFKLEDLVKWSYSDDWGWTPTEAPLWKLLGFGSYKEQLKD